MAESSKLEKILGTTLTLVAGFDIGFYIQQNKQQLNELNENGQICAALIANGANLIIRDFYDLKRENRLYDFNKHKRNIELFNLCGLAGYSAGIIKDFFQQ